MIASTLITLATLFQGAPPVGGEPPIEAMFFVHGTCVRLITPDGDRTKDCNSAVGQVIYSTGRLAYWFSIPKQALISFSGTKESSDDRQGSLELNLVTSGSNAAGINGRAATGSCSFSNPWLGQAYIRCRAKTAAGEFIAEFMTDGKPPEKMGS